MVGCDEIMRLFCFCYVYIYVNLALGCELWLCMHGWPIYSAIMHVLSSVSCAISLLTSLFSPQVWVPSHMITVPLMWVSIAVESNKEWGFISLTTAICMKVRGWVELSLLCVVCTSC